METSYVALVYGDSLRDNFVGYTPVDKVKFDALETEFNTEMKNKRPYLAKLLRIEAALVETLPDHVVTARFWAVEDRFQRVVPLATRRRYTESVPKQGDVQWQNPTFVRDQTRALVDVIHANYLINIGREKSVKRLKLIMGLGFLGMLLGATLLLLGTLMISTNLWTQTEVAGYVALFVSGVLGSTLSIANRLQTAVSRDAMTEDGLFELTGLRVGWVGILTSLLMGGAFAIVLYWIVMAGVLDKALPVSQSSAPSVNYAPDKIETGNDTTASPPDVEKKTSAEKNASNNQTLSENPESFSSESPAKIDAASSDNMDSGTVATKLPIDQQLLVPKTAGLTKGEPTIHGALRLRSYPDFFNMLILAFLAGFAERFVPDILGRLNKTNDS